MKPQIQPFLPLLAKQHLPSFPIRNFRTIVCCKPKWVFGSMSVTSSSNKTGCWVCSFNCDRSSPRIPLYTGGSCPHVLMGSGRHISNGFFHLERLSEGHHHQQALLSHTAFPPHGTARRWKGTG